MNKYVLLYSGGKMPESEAERIAVLKEWEVWYGGLGAAVVDPGSPFTFEAKSIASDGRVSEGPVGSMASGYTIIQADSFDEAVLMAKVNPLLKSGGQISVYQTFNMV